ncbi:hypothetical protein AArcSt11_02820 [Natranaeroarchaeum aerophilus]|uniref:Uncharacterized protein n=2 Tax=Natranaeroarchaeum aerophilus TaxID=2917711 RepID=A0AAE3FP99_9EURY|nr:hypothetical protein [Natranaeroarchaeum aerophilus]
MGVMGVTAQETPTNETDEFEDDLGDEYEQLIDAETRVVEWSYDSGVFTITVDADEDTELGITEAGGFEEGSGSYNFETVEIPEGESTVTFSTRDGNGAAVTISTQESLAQGTGAYLSTGTDVEENPFRHFGGTSGLFSGVGMTVLLAGLAAGYVVRSENRGVIEK